MKALRHTPNEKDIPRLGAPSLIAPGTTNNLMYTDVKTDTNQASDHPVDLQDVNRLLELGKILSSILTEEELKILQDTITIRSAQVALSLQEK